MWESGTLDLAKIPLMFLDDNKMRFIMKGYNVEEIQDGGPNHFDIL